MITIAFECRYFNDLRLDQLYDLMAIRQEVFVVEQNCPYLDADGKDREAYHLLGYSTDYRLVAYARLLRPGLSYPNYASIGRVVTHASIRRQGGGRALMEAAIAQTRALFPGAAIKISAQVYLTHFYQSLGFQTVGGQYLEDDIPHIGMLLNV